MKRIGTNLMSSLNVESIDKGFEKKPRGRTDKLLSKSILLGDKTRRRRASLSIAGRNMRITSITTGSEKKGNR